MKADYISPYKNTWVPNDFDQDDRIAVSGYGVCTVVSHNCLHYEDLVLTVAFEDGREGQVWPNLQWVALNWEDDDE